MVEKIIDEMKERKKKLENIRKLGVDPFAHEFKKTHSVKEIKDKFGKIKPEEKKTNTKFSIAGRIKSLRKHGKLIFCDLEDYSGKIQVFLEYKTIGKKDFDFFENVNVGDIIGVNGFIFKTKRGELTVHAKKFKFLTKSLRPLPKEWSGLKDKEVRYRQRYLDLLMNPEVKEIFKKRSEIIYAMREFMKNKRYIEVETPILQPIYGGALARPFVTHHNTLNMNMYLRISDEMYLKRLIAGGFEKVFEFSIDFRNEGIDTSHNPEFLMVEAMTAYSDYKDGMKLFEEWIEYTVKKVLGTTKVAYGKHELDFKTPWKRLTVVEAIKKHLKLDVQKKSIKELIQFAKKHGVKLIEKKPTKGELVAAIFEEFVEPKIIQPTIIYDYPAEISPLAKKCKKNPDFTERFEVFVCGKELGNNYTEITDPIELRNNFKQQLKRSEAGDEEAHPMDEDFLTAMEYGMPPTCGIAVGIDRFVMFLTNSQSIRDVVLFPQLRAKTKEELFGDETKDTVLQRVSGKKKAFIFFY